MGRQSLGRALERIASWTGRKLTFMEVCGTHTMAAARFGIRSLLPKNVSLISGPGCPVCVTPVGYVDHAIALARKEFITICTFGDMMRVPGSDIDDSDTVFNNLNTARAEGADIRVVYSPLDALRIAEAEPERQIVFLGVGFETTAPGLAASILRARDRGMNNFSMLIAAKTVPEALTALARSKDTAIDGFLCPGHVSAILGTAVYRPFADEYNLACAVAGFEAEEMLEGIACLVEQIKEGNRRVDNCYALVVKPEGNKRALEIMWSVFEPTDSVWRGIGLIPKSGLRIRDEFSKFDAAKLFDAALPIAREPKGCRCGDVLKGALRPEECGLFGNRCTPSNPRGACMVSGEGACAASYNYQSEEEIS
jgi:hydrogenase expression/formation protein HypD